MTPLTNIVAQELVNITVQTIYLKLSDTWLCGLYRGATFIGVCWDFKINKAASFIKAADELFPKDLNDIADFEKKYSDRVTYHSHRDYNYYDLSTVNLPTLLVGQVD